MILKCDPISEDLSKIWSSRDLIGSNHLMLQGVTQTK